MNLEIINFIREHDNWEELLTSPPYSLSIKRKDTRILFKYSQIDSDFSLEIVREARGLILEDKTWNVVCYPFKKFFNYGEAYADEIDWKSAKVTSKEDGSLIKVYFYNGEWKVGTNSTIDAEDAALNSPYYKNFMELFNVAADNCKFDFDKLNPNYTYLMELCSCHNIIVVPYNEPKLFHIGTRNNITCEEVEVDIGIEKPKQYMLSSLDDCIAMAATFDFTQEGFVVVDKNYHRVKVKSEDYVRVHRLANNGSITLERAIDLIRTNELEEFLVYCPQYTNFINDVRHRFNKFCSDIYFNVNMALIEKMDCETRKDFAAVAKTFKYPMVWFKVYETESFDIDAWINSLTTAKLATYLEKY